MPIDPKGLLLKSAAVAGVDQAIKYVHKIEPNSPANKPGGASDQYIKEVYRLYPESGINPEIVVAQWAVETGAGTDRLWIDRLNPAGLGVTDARDFGYTWDSPAKAARGHVVHLTGYVDGYNRGVRSYLNDDPRYLLLLGTAYAGTARTVADLEGTWATDSQYAEKIAWRVEGIRGAEPVVTPPPAGDIIYGKCPKPTWKDRIIPDRQNSAWNDLGPRGLKGITYHRMLGTLWGTDGYFRADGGNKGLTDFGIDNNTGEILLWNDYLGRPSQGVSPNRAGWASGPWENPPGDGRALVAKYGINAINRDLVSLEIAGNYDSPLSSKAFREIVRLSAYLADQAKIPYTDYPYNPHTGLVFTYTHNEFQNHKPCPGAVVLGQVDTIIRETAAYMKIFQTGQK